MINAVGIEIIRHFAKTAYPPGVAIACHRLPVVSGKSPVLTQIGEIIGWRTTLGIHIEKTGCSPGINAIATDADGISPFRVTPFSRAYSLTLKIAHERNWAKLPIMDFSLAWDYSPPLCRSVHGNCRSFPIPKVCSIFLSRRSQKQAYGKSNGVHL